MDSLFYALIYNWLTKRINTFGITAATNLTNQVTSFALVLVTIWVILRGYRMVTGQSREPMMSTVAQMIKIALIVVAAKTISVAGSDFYTFLNTTLPQEINYVVTGDANSPTTQIDQNLLEMSAAMSAIDMVQVPTNDPALAAEKSHTSFIASIGIAAPAMTAGAMLLLYQIALAMLTGLAPLFIMCLIFDSTKQLFNKWLMFLLGTMFSMAMLNLVISWTLDLTERVAAALWTTDALTRMTGLTAQGFSTQAFQQGGVGLLMTALIVSTPPMAAMLFNGTIGTFYGYSQMAGGAGQTHPGPQGQAPGTYPSMQVNGGGAPATAHGQTAKAPSGFQSPQRAFVQNTPTSLDVTKNRPNDGRPA